MKPPRHIGRIRLLAPILGRARRRWRGGPLVPMIWRRRRAHARPATPQRPVSPPSVFNSYAFNLTLVWPAGIAARAGALRHVETRLSERFRAVPEPGRLVTLAERLWLRSGKSDPPKAPVPVSPNASQMGSHQRPAGGRQDKSGASVPREYRPESSASAAPRAAEAPAVNVLRAGAPRIGMPRATRAGAIRQGSAPPAAEARAAAATAGLPSARAPASMRWGAVATPAEKRPASQRRPSLPGASLVWRKEEAGGEGPRPASRQAYAHRTPGAERVWRRPPPAPVRDAAGIVHDVATMSVPGRSDSHVRTDRLVAPAHTAPAALAAPAAIQPAEMSRLVDEVVRRLDRIGRDERMRRGI